MKTTAQQRAFGSTTPALAVQVKSSSSVVGVRSGGESHGGQDGRCGLQLTVVTEKFLKESTAERAEFGMVHNANQSDNFVAVRLP